MNQKKLKLIKYINMDRKEREKIRKQVIKIIEKHLVKGGYINDLDMIQFVYINMNIELGKSIIGLVNYAKENPDTISDSSISACLGHDIGGVLRGDQYFIPKALSYSKFY